MISRFQFYLLTINYILGTTLFVLIQRLVTQAGQDAWLMPMWAGSFGLLVGLFWILLFRYYPGKSLVQIPMDAWGRPLGIFVAVLYFLFFCNLAGWVLRNLSDFMNATLMPETPKSMLHVMFLLVACYSVAHGAETIGRLNQVITPFLFFPFWLVLLLATVNWDWERLQPVFHSDLGAILQYHSFIGFPYMETIALTMLFPLVKQGAGRPILLGMLTASVSLSLTMFMIIGLLGVERASRLTFPVYTVVQEVSIGEAIINIHSIISVILLILIFIKLLVLIYGAYETLRQVFRPKTRWPHFLGLTILLSATALSIYENPIQNGEWNVKYTFIYDSFFVLLIPFLLLVTTWAKRRFEKRIKRRMN
ncbi:spore germination protein [Brevibacillus humidisoli]|uniref:GerAB/ArcD/ProY family transporter n=1 Tax=Brevibacillus humidisoli TaxID=2895522 RepID=UPI001E64654E|nr:endospore germination permease [Brevibacillus humidisoli]UFJ42669.1 spore germination protein [Brevibacillus humidisoli]